VIADRLLVLATGFLLAVLWFDLMFDVQVLAHRHADELPEPVLASIAGYYRRVTTEASPMGRVVAVSMALLLGTAVHQATRGTTPGWVSVVTLAGTAIGPGLAGARVLRRARRLGSRADALVEQTRLARSIARDHGICLVAMLTVAAVQLGA
jgi:hypothetical protein